MAISCSFVPKIAVAIPATVVNVTTNPQSVDKNSPIESNALAIKLITSIILSLLVMLLTNCSHALLTLFNAASIPSI